MQILIIKANTTNLNGRKSKMNINDERESKLSLIDREKIANLIKKALNEKTDEALDTLDDYYMEFHGPHSHEAEQEYFLIYDALGISIISVRSEDPINKLKQLLDILESCEEAEKINRELSSIYGHYDNIIEQILEEYIMSERDDNKTGNNQ